MQGSQQENFFHFGEDDMMQSLKTYDAIYIYQGATAILATQVSSADALSVNSDDRVGIGLWGCGEQGQAPVACKGIDTLSDATDETSGY